MKTLLKAVAVGAALIAVGVGLLFYVTSGMVDTVDQFLTAVKQHRYQRAYQYLSRDFQASTSRAELEAFLQRSALQDYQTASWSSRSYSIGGGELGGTVTTSGGGTVPLRVRFVKENGDWKIYAIHKPPSGLIRDDNASPPIPDKAQQLQLVRRTMERFARAVNTKDFRDFHRHISGVWQREITVARFNEIFKPFMDANLDLMPLQNLTPAMDKPASVNDKGVLTLEGHYPTKPSRVRFDFGYVYEGVSWKLVRTHVQITPAE
jgi:hypothetical protein